MSWAYPLLAALTLAVITGFAIWLGLRAARKQGEAEREVHDVNASFDAAQRMQDADAAGPRTVDDAVKRLRDGTA